MWSLAFCLLLLAGLTRAGDVDGRIIGGENTNIADHNYQTSIRFSGQHNCGAVLLSNIRAVTVAHCVGSAAGTYQIVAGTSDHAIQTCATCAMRTLSAIVRHPSFSNNPATGIPNDVAVLWFNSIASNVNIGHITMATDADGDFAGDSCVILGWGLTTPGGSQLPNTLQRAQVTVVSNNTCTEVWGAARIREEHICAQQPGVTACTGDDGGPLVCGGRLAGIYSWNEAFCGDQFPAVFQRISYQRQWILDNM